MSNRKKVQGVSAVAKAMPGHAAYGIRRYLKPYVLHLGPFHIRC